MSQIIYFKHPITKNTQSTQKIKSLTLQHKLNPQITRKTTLSQPQEPQSSNLLSKKIKLNQNVNKNKENKKQVTHIKQRSDIPTKS